MSDKEWIRPDIPMRCTYKTGQSLGESPHQHNEMYNKQKLYDSILDLVGNTPLVRLNRIPKQEGVECDIYVKCEFMNPAGSIKDRIAKRMVEEAEKCGRVKPGDGLIEPTSGNTGIGLALISAVKGYDCTIVMPEKMSQEKEYMLRGLGAKTVRTPTDALYDEPASNFRTADRLKAEKGDSSHVLNQYLNPYNPITHFDQTAEEILRDCTEDDTGEIKLDMVVVGLGTGGSYTGIERKIHSRLPNCKVVPVDPVGSVLAPSHNDHHEHFEVEGVGYEFAPSVLQTPDPVMAEKVTDQDSFDMARRLLKEEGILCGGSSGMIMVGALRAAKKHGLGKGDRLVALMPDSIRNYLTKHLSDSWMYSRGFLNFPGGEKFAKPWFSNSTSDVRKIVKPTVTVRPSTCILDVMDSLRRAGKELALVVDDESFNVCGVFDSGAYFALIQGKVEPRSEVDQVMKRNIKIFKDSETLEQVARWLSDETYVVIVDKQGE